MGCYPFPTHLATPSPISWQAPPFSTFRLDNAYFITTIVKLFNILSVLVIRLTRVGKNNEAAYRIVVAEKRKAVKGAYQELLGFYNPAENKKIDFKKDRIEFWVAQGATPSDTVASLLKNNGMSGMEKFMAPRNLKRLSKDPAVIAAAAAAAAPKEAPADVPVAA
jgi:small subunit ribosomal protein S16